MKVEEIAEAVMEKFEAWNMQDAELERVLRDIVKGEV